MMTPDEQLKAVREMFPAVHAEVERLHTENTTLSGHVAALQAQLDAAVEASDPAALAERDGWVSEYIKQLRAKVECLRAENIDLGTRMQRFYEKVAKLEAENAASKLAYETMVSELAKRNAENAELLDVCKQLRVVIAFKGC